MKWIHTDREELIEQNRAKFLGYDWYITSWRGASVVIHLMDCDGLSHYCGHVSEGECPTCHTKLPEEIVTMTRLILG